VAVGDSVLDLLTGRGPDLGSVALALLAVATASYLGALIATSALAGARRARSATASGVLGTATAAAVLVLVPGAALHRVVTVLAVGTIGALGSTAAACLRPLPRRTPADRPPHRAPGSVPQSDCGDLGRIGWEAIP
jgi:O-antigen/teichoic acid export membrane protein